MMPRKKRLMIMIVSICVLLVIIMATLILLYINTDMFKSNQKLFNKYVGQSIKNAETFYDEIEKSKYDELLQQNKYTEQTQIKVNVTENIGTSLESTQNSINLLKLEINGKTDKNNQYNYKDIHLANDKEELSQVEYIQKENTYGIRFSDLFKQYILVNNENLKELFEKANYNEENLANIPDTIEFNKDIKNTIQFSKEEKEKIKAKYSNIISSNLTKDNFSKQAEQEIQIDEKNTKVNAYVLTLTKEQLNTIYIRLLEEAKQDETILNKFDDIQSLVQGYELIETKSLKDQFIEDVEDLITNITKNNIGQDEVKIIVYEKNQTTVKIMIQHPDYEFSIELLSYEGENYLKIFYEDKILEKKQIFTCKKENEKISIIFDNDKKDEKMQYSIVVNEKVDGNNGVKNIVAKCEDESNRVEATIKQNVNIVDKFDEEITLDDKNSINLSKLESEQVQIVLNQVNNSVSKKIDKISSSIKADDLLDVLRIVGIAGQGQIEQGNGITESEKNRFNSQFEILQGENLDSDTILNLIESIKENLIDLEVVSNTELKLKLDRLDKNEEIATKISTFIEKNKDKKYNVKIEYDETTGLVNDILLTIVEKE